MTSKSQLTCALALVTLMGPGVVAAEQLINDNLVVTGNACIGPDCATGDADANLKGVILKGDIPKLHFNSTNSSFIDWQISTSATNGGARNFILNATRSTGLTSPLFIRGQAPTGSFLIEDNGDIGLGTSLPQKEVHIMDGTTPTLRLEQDTSEGGASHTWDIAAGSNGLTLTDVGSILSLSPFRIENGAGTSSIHVNSLGNVGLGTNLPEGKLHTKGNGVQLSYFESGDGGPVQVRFRTDSENRRFLAVNNANEVKSQIIFLDDRINFTGQTDSGANLWLSIGPNGIVSQGPTCGSPCDLTFDPDVFTVPSIAERAEYMWTNMHLPAIGPTSPDEPINLTEKMGGVIHELEVAHIYIEELHAELTTLRQRDAQREDQIKWLTEKLLELDAR